MARYTREISWRFLGPPGLAQSFIPQARKVYGLIESTYAANLHNGAIQREIAPGVLVRAVRVDLQPVVTIDVRGLAERMAVSSIPLQGFVLLPTSDTFPDGLDETDEAAVLTPGVASGRPIYVAWFGDEESASRSSATGILNRLYATQYPEGLKECGNIDWHNGGDLSVTWYGPQARYFSDDDRYNVNSLMQKKVFSQGQTLFDGDTFVGSFDATEWGVFAAALRRVDGALWLYVIHGVGGDTPMDTALVRYLVDTAPETPEFGDWALSGEHELLWSGVSDSLYVPWFINASCTQASRIGFSPTGDGHDTLYTLSFDAASLATEDLSVGKTTSFSNVSPPLFDDPEILHFEFDDQPIAVDYRGDTRVFLTMDYRAYSIREIFPPVDGPEYRHTDARCTVRLDGQAFTLVDVTLDWGTRVYDPQNVPPDSATVLQRGLLYADLRIGLFSAIEQTIGSPSGPIEFSTMVQLPGGVVLRSGVVTYTGQDALIGYATDGVSGVPALLNLTISHLPLSSNPLGAVSGLVLAQALLQWPANNFLPYYKMASVFDATLGQRKIVDDHYWVGTWQSYRGLIAVSQLGFASDPVNYLAGGDMAALLGVGDVNLRAWPGWTLRRSF